MRLQLVALSGVFAALVFAGTQLRVPTGIGYINLGDAVIYVTSYIFGPYAFFASSIGSAIADLIAGYPVYIAPTFVIKGLMGAVGGLILYKASKPSFVRRLLAALAIEAIMVLGYFSFEVFFYGFTPALGSVVPNLIQATGALVIGIPLTYLFKYRFCDKLKSVK
ncbi:MAG: ECF transporter S component [Saccharofermentans sp.]|nr:ECF transporter S component [Saccharofermentans sp.]